MNKEYSGIGLGVLGIGLGLMLSLPPAWWPKMPPPLVQVGVVIGLVLFAIGFGITGLGTWPGLPEPRGPIAVSLLGAILLLGGVGWWKLAPGFGARTFAVSAITQSPDKESPHLKTTPSSGLVIQPASVPVQKAPAFILAIKAHNFAKSLREFREDFVRNDKKWHDIEWEAYSHAEETAEKDKIWNDNAARAQGRQQTFTNRFHQVYKEYAVELSEELNKDLKSIGIVPLTPGFATPLPPKFDTFKVTLESPAVKFIVTEGLGTRMADYFDDLANQYPHEVGDEPSKIP